MSKIVYPNEGNAKLVNGRISALKDSINEDIEKMGGIEEFNKNSCAPEIISNWLYKLLTILEEVD